MIGGPNPGARVVVAISGGLGNQMFQFAMARRFAYVNAAELLLYLGTRFNPRRSGREYGLGKFQIAGRLATHDEAGGLRRVRRWRQILARRFPGILPARDPELFTEKDMRFDPAVLLLRGRVKFNGVWQNEGYFADTADLIRRDFSLRNDLDRQNLAALNRIKSSSSCFIHVRRGDYVGGGLHTCPPEYYSEAVGIVRERVGASVRFFVFSDEPDWVRQMRIGGSDAEIVDWNSEAPERDLELMRACRHAIIANSSFSWWGAWLGDLGTRTVIAPKVWFRGRTDMDDIVPRRWLRL
jgi:Glycosyl transferase family 11